MSQATTTDAADHSQAPQRAAPRPCVLLMLTLGMALALYGYCLVRTAWLSDDAYITFRTVENVVTGHGLTWNTDERVQAYTHPLWMFLLSAGRLVSGEIYYSSLITSMALSLAAVLVLALGIARTTGAALAAVMICVFSRAFVDYSTSGLENPLSYLLLSLFLLLYLRQETMTPRRLLQLALLASLLVLNRMDLLLLVAPALGYAFWQNRSLKAAGLILLGFAPLIAWEIFSVIYYGFPFPNTAYAKLNTGIPAMDLARCGLNYLLDSLQTDPLTLLAIGAALLTGLLRQDRRSSAIAVGLALYLLYVVRIGGDFMSGRFLAVPLLAATALLAAMPIRLSGARWLSVGLLVACGGLMAPRPAIFISSVYGLAWSWRPDLQPIVDERAYYYPETGLLRDRLGLPSRIEAFIASIQQLRGRGSLVAGSATIGVYGFHMGPTVHVVDYYALADPLLARLPMKSDPNWRIGHFARHVPDGYLEKQQSADNRLSDPDLDAFYEKLCRITRGPLFTRQRWQTILDMNLGRYDHLVNREFYRHPPERVWLAEVNGGPKPRNISRNLPRDARGLLVLPAAGFIVILNDTSHARQLEASLPGNGQYQIDYPQPGQFPVHQRVAAASSLSSLVTRRIDVPAEVAARGYSLLRIFPVGGDDPYNLGFIRPLEEKSQ